jgi:O-methyltransferase
MRGLLNKLIPASTPTKENGATQSWERPIDTPALRRAAMDMAVLNVHISTRRERERKEGEDKHDTLLGDYLEFGVYRGGTFLHAHHRARELMPWMRFFAFDSFEGLPALDGVDAQGEFYEGQFACTRPDFDDNLRAAGADMDRIEIVEGWFDATLTDALRRERRLEIASIVFIDCDLYASTVPVLDFIKPLLRQGSIVLFDDWYHFRADAKKGVQRATNEWLERNPELSLTTWHPFCHHGQSFIVNVA